MEEECARGSDQASSSIAVEEKGSRTKRKSRDEPELTPYGSSRIDVPTAEPPNNDGAEQHGVSDQCSLHGEPLNLLKSKLGQSDIGFDSVKAVTEGEEFQEISWSALAENELEELALSTLDTIFRSAIKQITSRGYSEEVATKAVLRPGLYLGGKDTESNIVDNTIAFIRNRQDVDSSGEHLFEDLPQLETYILAEMVCVLREVRPSFSIGDAMWCLLICDMNVADACAMETNPSSLTMDDNSLGTSSSSNTSNSKNDTKNSQAGRSSHLPKPRNPNASFSQSSQSEPPVFAIPKLPPPRKTSSGDPLALGEQSSQKEFSILLPSLIEKPSVAVKECRSVSQVPQSSRTEEKHEKLASGKKKHTNRSKRESILPEKTVNFEKTYHVYGSKAALRSGKLAAFGSLVLDKKYKLVSDTTIASLKNASLKLSRALGAEVFQAKSDNIDLSTGPKPALKLSSSAIASIESSLLARSSASTSSNPNSSSEHSDHSVTSVSSRKILEGLPQDKKNDMLLQLVPRVQKLQTQLQEWTEWAQQKVTQAARRLSKDKEDLKTLRQEKEEVARLNKEEQMTEENTIKKLSEASGQVEHANAEVCRLEVENAELRLEMEAAKLKTAESAANCQAVVTREIKTLQQYESRDRQKAKLQEELTTNKRNLSQVQKQLQQSKEFRKQLEASLKQEEKLKNEALARANSERKGREQIEASAEANEELIRLQTENDFQKYRDLLQKLESEVAQLKLKADSSKIDGTHASQLVEHKSKHYRPPEAESQGFRGYIRRERECVMCLTEEMSVVFLPCAHQVVCAKCNELHEKQGMKECPSCRTPIQQRVCVRLADS